MQPKLDVRWQRLMPGGRAMLFHDLGRLLQQYCWQAGASDRLDECGKVTQRPAGA
jgi:hypothetical protein